MAPNDLVFQRASKGTVGHSFWIRFTRALEGIRYVLGPKGFHVATMGSLFTAEKVGSLNLYHQVQK